MDVAEAESWFKDTRDSSAPRAMVLDDQMRIRRILVATTSPGGEHVAFQVIAAHAATNSFSNGLFILDRRRSRTPRLVADLGPVELSRTPYGSPVAEPVPNTIRWSTDGKYLGYLKRDSNSGHRQLWLIDSGSWSARAAGQVDRDIVDFTFEPSGVSIELLLGHNHEELTRKYREADRRGFRLKPGAMPLRVGHWFISECDDASLSVHVIEFPCQPTPIRVDFKGNRLSDAQATGLDARRRLPGQSGMQGQRAIARDSASRIVAWFASTRANPASTSETEPRVQFGADMEKSQICRHAECTGDISELMWSEDTGEVLFKRLHGHRNGTTSLYAWDPATNALRRLLRDEQATRSCSVAGRQIVCIRSEWTRPGFLVAIDARSAERRELADPNRVLSGLVFPRVEAFAWQDADGNEALGHLVYPVRYQQGRRYPLVIVSYSFRGFLQSVGDEHAIFPMATEGFMVLYFSIPFSSKGEQGASRSQRDSIALNWSTQRSSGLDWILNELDERGLIDTSRMGISGLSNGSTLVDEAIVQGRRFAAASAGYSNTSPVSKYFLNDMLRSISFTEERIAAIERNSPGSNARQVETPLLLNVADIELHGAVPNYVSLKDAGKAVEMYVYSNEYHVKYQPAHKDAVFRRNMQWFLFWLQGREVADPVDPDQYVRWGAMKAARERRLAGNSR